MNLVSNSDIVKADRELARKHIELLTGDANSPCHFRLIHDSQNGGRNLSGTVDDLWPEFETAHSDGYGVFVVVNAGGHDDASISTIRAVFIDGDDMPLPQAHEWHDCLTPPAFIVKRSATRWHAYWPVIDMPVAAFRGLQQRLAAFYGSDPVICNPSRVMRLAGTLHLKDPSNPQLMTIEPDTTHSWGMVYTTAEVLASLPTVAVKLSDPRPAAPGVQIDSPDNVRRFTIYLQQCVERGDVAVEGQKGDNRTLQVANIGMDLGCSPSKAHELMLAHFNDHCQPPWDMDELAVKVSNAAKSRENALGCDAVSPSSEAFAKIAAANASAETNKGKPSPFRVVFEDEMDNEPPIEWLIPEVLQRRSTMMIVGMKQSYKSFLALDMALAVATGRETFGVKPTRTGATLYAALEGRRGIKTDRRRAWRLAKGIDGKIASFGVCSAPHVVSKDECNDFINRVRDAYPSGLELIVLETANKMLLGLDENSAKDAALLTNLMDELVEHLGCAVIVIHHKSDKANAAEVRGSSAFEANVDQVMQIAADRAAVTLTARITKMKDGEPRETPWHFRGRQSGPSMVLDLLSAAEHAQAKKGADRYDTKAVGAALARLKAHGIDAGQSTPNLAAELFPPEENDDIDGHARRLDAAARQLNRLAKGKLEAYCDANSRGHLIWYLPN